MKTIFTLLASLILSVAAFATDARPKTTLTINSADRGDIRVVIDGRRFEPNDNYMRIESLDAGYHSIKVYRERSTGLFRIFGKMYEVVYNNTLTIKPRTSVTISVDRFGKATVLESRMKGRFETNPRVFDGSDNRVWDQNHDFDFGRGNNQGDYDNDRDNRDGRFGGRNDNGYNDNTFNKAMSDFEFSRTLSSIQKEWNEANKMKSAKQVISGSFFTAIQVKQILQLFNLENNKLELAKQAYAKTIDQRNYVMINDVFSFNSSKDDLARYIRSH